MKGATKSGRREERHTWDDMPRMQIGNIFQENTKRADAYRESTGRVQGAYRQSVQGEYMQHKNT